MEIFIWSINLLNKKQSKNKQIVVSFDNDTFAKINALANSKEITKAEFIRSSLNIEFCEKRTPKQKRVHKTTDPKLLYHLNKIGVNLNQIARQVNTAGVTETNILIQLVKIEEELKRLL